MTWIALPAGARVSRFNQIEKADEFLVAMPLHIAADHGPVEHVERCKERGAIALIIMRRRPGPSLLERQAGLRAVKRLDLALLVEREDDRVGRRRDIKADDVAELVNKLGIVGKLELPNAVRLAAVGTPDPVNRTGANAYFPSHQRSRPVGRLTRRSLMRPRHNQGDGLQGQSRDARGTGVIAQQAFRPFLHCPFLPAPHACLGRTRPPHDLAGANPIGAQQHNLGSPDVTLRGVTILRDPLKARSIRGRKVDDYTTAHPH